MKKKKYQPKYCLYCGKVIPKRKNESMNSYNKRKFCSSYCQHKFRSKENSVIVKCDCCGKEFKIKKSREKKHNFCSLDCFHRFKHLKGTELVKCDWCGKEIRKTKSQIQKTRHNFCSLECLGKWQSKFLIGESSYGWKGGLSNINGLIRASKKMTEWRVRVFKRDNYTCQKCGDKKGGNLEAHHIKPLSQIIKDNDIKTMYDALNCKELWDVNNGITLCKKCHHKIHKGELKL